MKKIISIIFGILFGLLSLYVLYRVTDYYVLAEHWYNVLHAIPYTTIIFVLIWLILVYLFCIDYKVFFKFSILSAFITIIIAPLIFIFNDISTKNILSVINAYIFLTLLIGIPILIVILIQILIKNKQKKKLINN